MVSTPNSVIYFGGYDFNVETITLDTVAEFKNLHWTKLKPMSQKRSSHNTIRFDDLLFIIGGDIVE